MAKRYVLALDQGTTGSTDLVVEPEPPPYGASPS